MRNWLRGSRSSTLFQVSLALTSVALMSTGCECETPDMPDATVGDDAGPDARIARDAGPDARRDAGPTVRCGDGIRAGAETCDDANAAGGDGCSSTCTIEAGFRCSGSPSACSGICGDSMVVTGEGCDDGGMTPGDGCNPMCATEPGFSCTGSPSVCTPGCGDGVVLGSEA